MENKQYIKPQAEIKAFVTEDVIARSGLNIEGTGIGSVDNLFK